MDTMALEADGNVAISHLIFCLSFACVKSGTLCVRTGQDYPSVGLVKNLGKQAECLERNVYTETILS